MPAGMFSMGSEQIPFWRHFRIHLRRGALHSLRAEERGGFFGSLLMQVNEYGNHCRDGSATQLENDLSSAALLGLHLGWPA